MCRLSWKLEQFEVSKSSLNRWPLIRRTRLLPPLGVDPIWCNFARKPVFCLHIRNPACLWNEAGLGLHVLLDRLVGRHAHPSLIASASGMLHATNGGDMSIKHYTQDLEETALVIAIKAKAVAACEWHEDVLVNQGDPDADRHAYALATNACKSGEFAGQRQDLLDAVKDVIDMSADECGRCEDNRHA
jgi:hypothetical protein